MMWATSKHVFKIKTFRNLFKNYMQSSQVYNAKKTDYVTNVFLRLTKVKAAVEYNLTQKLESQFISWLDVT